MIKSIKKINRMGLIHSAYCFSLKFSINICIGLIIPNSDPPVITEKIAPYIIKYANHSTKLLRFLKLSSLYKYIPVKM